ncbi:Replicase polyprotein 1ab [Trichinella pseudospiralis]
MLTKFFLLFNILILLHASLIDNFAPAEVLYLQKYFCNQKCFNAVKEHDLHPNSMKKCIRFCTAERGIK